MEHIFVGTVSSFVGSYRVDIYRTNNVMVNGDWHLLYCYEYHNSDRPIASVIESNGFMRAVETAYQ